MFKNASDKEEFIKNNNLQLESFIGTQLVSIKFRDNGNSFLLVFAGNQSNFSSKIQLFNCFLFLEDGIFGLSVSGIFIKNLGVFAFEYCARHGLNSTDFVELNISASDKTVIGQKNNKSLLIGCERMAITHNVEESSDFWEL